MIRLSIYLAMSFCLFFNSIFGQDNIKIEPFTKIIVSPHIEVSIVEGNKETVEIEEIKVDSDKLNVEVKNNTLRIYLEDAKEITKDKKVIKNGNKMKVPIYKGTVVKARITYKNLEELSIRGEETFTSTGVLKANRFRLKIYGESKINFNEVELSELRTTIYGESRLNLKSGDIKEHKVTAYGESEIDALGVKNESTKITAYGEASFNINASEEIKITAYGDATLNYKGTAEINKGINIGDIEINKIE